MSHMVKTDGNVLCPAEGFRAARESQNSMMDFAKEARLAEREGNMELRESICRNGMSHYMGLLRYACAESSDNSPAACRERFEKSASLLMKISEISEIRGDKEGKERYELLGMNLKDLASELR